MVKGLQVGETWRQGSQAGITIVGFAVIKEVDGRNGATRKVVLLVTPKKSRQWVEQDEFTHRYKWVPK